MVLGKSGIIIRLIEMRVTLKLGIVAGRGVKLIVHEHLSHIEHGTMLQLQ